MLDPRLFLYIDYVLANHVAPCRTVPAPDCECLYKVQKAIVGCEKNPGCNVLPHGEFCGWIKMAAHIYHKTGCPLKGGGCLKPELCDGKCEIFKNYWHECAASLECSMTALNMYYHLNKNEIAKCKGNTPCEKLLYCHVKGLEHCQEDIEQHYWEKFYDKNVCPCKTYY